MLTSTAPVRAGWLSDGCTPGKLCGLVALPRKGLAKLVLRRVGPPSTANDHWSPSLHPSHEWMMNRSNAIVTLSCGPRPSGETGLALPSRSSTFAWLSKRPRKRRPVGVRSTFGSDHSGRGASSSKSFEYTMVPPERPAHAGHAM